LHAIRVKTRSSFWTGDGGASGRRNFLGGIALEAPFASIGVSSLLFVVTPDGDHEPVVCHLLRGLPTPSLDVGPPVGNRRSSLGGCFDCLQRPAAPGVARRPPVRCGTALLDETCSNDNHRGLGLQRIVAGLLAWLKSSGVVQR
jgi:hypothetical protein